VKFFDVSMASVFYAWVLTLICAVKSNSTGLYHQHLCSGLLQVSAPQERRVHVLLMLALALALARRWRGAHTAIGARLRLTRLHARLSGRSRARCGRGGASHLTPCSAFLIPRVTTIFCVLGSDGKS